jgi:hypothetical protein
MGFPDWDAQLYHMKEAIKQAPEQDAIQFHSKI